jgi:hypothetical protein
MAGKVPITYEDGTVLYFDGNPTDKDISEAYSQNKLEESIGMGKVQRGNAQAPNSMPDAGGFYVGGAATGASGQPRMLVNNQTGEMKFADPREKIKYQAEHSATSGTAEIPEEIAQGLVDYSLDPTKTTTLRGNQRMAAITAAKKLDPDFNMNLYPARADYMKNVYSGKIYENVTALNTVTPHLKNLDEAIEKANVQKIPFQTAFVMAVKEATGDATITDLKTAKEVVDSEMQRALTNAAVTVEGMQEQRRLQNMKLSSYAQAKQYVKSVAHIIDQRGSQIEEEFVQRMGKKPKGVLLTPDAKKMLGTLSGKYVNTGVNKDGQAVGKKPDGTIEVIE